MADEPTPPVNTVTPAVGKRSKTQGDVPDALARRYYTDGRGGAGLGFYTDAKVEKPAFRDEGGKLAAARTDPNAIRDMARIAQHRGWTIITVRGEANFRREAWLAGRAIGLEVRGYRPTERDIQELDRRIDRRLGRDGRSPEPARKPREERARSPDDGREQLRLVEAVVRGRIKEPSAQERILAAARERVADLLNQGARFRSPPPHVRQPVGRERDRAR